VHYFVIVLVEPDFFIRASNFILVMWFPKYMIVRRKSNW